MRTLVHLSDLHFGRVDGALLEPLTRLIHRLQPNLVVVSGDLTQRAKSEQFQEARAWLDTLPRPQIVVPGNHDISLYNVYRRFFEPLTRYKRYITDDLSPTFIDDEIAVVGVNTARSLTFKDGRINKDQVAHVRERFAGLPDHLVRIVVTHHPFDLPEGHKEESDLVDRATMAMAAFAKIGVDVLLCGHLHGRHAGNTMDRYQFEDYAAVVVHAGTATSTRGRGEVNSFNVLHVDDGRVEVETYGWDMLGREFSLMHTESFFRSANLWSPHSTGVMAAGL